jgi:hypothetical protein
MSKYPLGRKPVSVKQAALPICSIATRASPNRSRRSLLSSSYRAGHLGSYATITAGSPLSPPHICTPFSAKGALCYHRSAATGHQGYRRGATTHAGGVWPDCNLRKRSPATVSTRGSRRSVASHAPTRSSPQRAIQRAAVSGATS